MNIVISNTSNLAIYEQIVAQIKDAIINKEILANEPLPSIRSLARDLQISVITTSRAYEVLASEGLVYSQPGKGYYISKSQTNMLMEKRLQTIEIQMMELINQCKNAELSKEDMIAMINLLYDS